MSEEEQKGLIPNTPNVGPPYSPLFPRHERLMRHSPSLRRATTHQDPSQSGMTDPDSDDNPTTQQIAASPDAAPTSLPRSPFRDLPRPVIIAAWVASIAFAMLMVFVVMSAGGHGSARSQPPRATPIAAGTAITQGNATTTTTATIISGTQPATNTPGGKAPAPAPTNLPAAAPTATPAHAPAPPPTATIDSSTCSWDDVAGQVAVQSQTIGANTVTVRAQLQWDLTSGGVWCGDFGTDVLVTSSSQTVTGTMTSTLTYKAANGSYTTLTGSKTPSYAFKFVGLVVGPQKASCGGPGGSFVGSGYNVTAQAANVCP